MGLAAELEDIERLYREGSLSDSEYATAKAAIIERLQSVGETSNKKSDSNSVRMLRLVFGVVFIGFGILMITGFLISIMDPNEQHNDAKNKVLVAVLGVLPFVLGCIFCFRRPS